MNTDPAPSTHEILISLFEALNAGMDRFEARGGKYGDLIEKHREAVIYQDARMRREGRR